MVLALVQYPRDVEAFNILSSLSSVFPGTVTGLTISGSTVDHTISDEAMPRTYPLKMSAHEGSHRGMDDIYITYLPSRVVGLVLFVVISSALDALLTLMHIQQGGREVNPLMTMALDQGLTAFMGAKMSLTGLGVTFLAIHQHTRLGIKALELLALVYGGLLTYHLIVFLSRP